MSGYALIFVLYSSGDFDRHFSIDPDTGIVKLDKALDFETQTQYSLMIHAVDGGDPPLEGTTTLTVDVTDESDNAPICDNTLIAVSIPESKLVGEQVF